MLPLKYASKVIACSPGEYFDSASRLSFSFRFVYSTTLNIRVEHIQKHYGSRPTTQS
jgi:hypothetical protein